jgi:hypothetical protein
LPNGGIIHASQERQPPWQRLRKYMIRDINILFSGIIYDTVARYAINMI